MIGHAVSNCMPVIAANRIGTEDGAKFYGHSFISDEWGEYTAEFGAGESGVLSATIDIEQVRAWRRDFPALRDAGFPTVA